MCNIIYCYVIIFILIIGSIIGLIFSIIWSLPIYICNYGYTLCNSHCYGTISQCYGTIRCGILCYDNYNVTEPQIIMHEHNSGYLVLMILSICILVLNILTILSINNR